MTHPANGNGIRTGAQYLSGLRDDREVWTRGNRVKDVTSEPGIHRGAKTLARFLDRQHDAQFRETVTYIDEDGDRCGVPFRIPKTQEDVIARGRAFTQWAQWSHGMFGRTPDYKNASLTALAGGAAFFAQGTTGNTDFAANVTAYHTHCRKNDLVLTHTLLNPGVNYQQQQSGLDSAEVALHVTKETDAGIYVSGARLLATLGPISDEIEVFPSTYLADDPKSVPFAFAFAIPVATKGLKMICRDTYDHEKSTFDAPLAGRFEEMDAVCIFKDVFVPWERVFLFGEASLCNTALNATHAFVYMMHQVACAKLAKAEFITGILCAIAKATGKDKDMFTQGMIAEVMQMTETVRALLFSAEQQAHGDEWGNFIPLRRPLETARNLFPKMYPRMIEIMQLLGASSLMATPAEADFSNELARDTEQYFQLSNLGSKDRVALFRLAHDTAVSGFGSRQVLYERFFFGPPGILAARYFDLYDKEPLIKRVERLLDEG